MDAPAEAQIDLNVVRDNVTGLRKHVGTAELAVLDGQLSNQPIGCITETDIAVAVAEGKDLNEIRIRDLIAHA